MNCMCNFSSNIFSFLAIYGFNSSSLQNVSIIGLKLNSIELLKPYSMKNYGFMKYTLIIK
jgi:hypothetical protein